MNSAAIYLEPLESSGNIFLGTSNKIVKNRHRSEIAKKKIKRIG